MNKENLKQNINEILQSDLPFSELAGKTIAVSGTRGFLASWLCEALEYLDVAVLPINKPEYNIYQSIEDFPDVDYIFHAASYASPVKFKENPVEVVLPNTVGTYNLLELVRRKSAEFIFFSTSGVYGWHPEHEYPLDESMFGSLDCANVNNCYLESKRLGEQLCVSYNYRYNVPVKMLRLGICYGPGMKLDGDGRLMQTFIKKVIDKEDFPIYNEHVYRSFMYITDVLSAIFYILFKGKTGPYNIAAEKEVSILEFAGGLSEMYPDSKVIHQERSDRLSVDFGRTWMDMTKLKGLGWSQKVSLKDGLRKTVESYK